MLKCGARSADNTSRQLIWSVITSKKDIKWIVATVNNKIQLDTRGYLLVQQIKLKCLNDRKTNRAGLCFHQRAKFFPRGLCIWRKALTTNRRAVRRFLDARAERAAGRARL